jgi:hypothetical protein
VLAAAIEFVDGCETIPVTAPIGDAAAALKAQHQALSLSEASARTFEQWARLHVDAFRSDGR